MLKMIFGLPVFINLWALFPRGNLFLLGQIIRLNYLSAGHLVEELKKAKVSSGSKTLLCQGLVLMHRLWCWNLFTARQAVIVLMKVQSIV
jgi:hypothetical protein